MYARLKAVVYGMVSSVTKTASASAAPLGHWSSIIVKSRRGRGKALKILESGRRAHSTTPSTPRLPATWRIQLTTGLFTRRLLAPVHSSLLHGLDVAIQYNVVHVCSVGLERRALLCSYYGSPESPLNNSRIFIDLDYSSGRVIEVDSYMWIIQWRFPASVAYNLKEPASVA